MRKKNLLETIITVRQQKLEKLLRTISLLRAKYREIEKQEQVIREKIKRIKNDIHLEMDRYSSRCSFTIADVNKMENRYQRMMMPLPGLERQKQACTGDRNAIRRQLEQTKNRFEQAKLKLDNIEKLKNEIL
ncbi:MAG: hypothetical protein CSA52_00935 [Gammaproteobacteria bacterium]|nr:MAG: hypothetical protein CSB48_08120 [Pseudomonadota bacterium]PIE38863.1 MAG: hypothetical protein CSA52_00935 [Gammaproteobacteria bacterium]